MDSTAGLRNLLERGDQSRRVAVAVVTEQRHFGNCCGSSPGS